VATQSTSGLRRRVAGTQNAAQADVFRDKTFWLLHAIRLDKISDISHLLK
jgi:hypothetical protein